MADKIVMTDSTKTSGIDISRRRFVMGTAAVLAASVAVPIITRPAYASAQARSLSFYHTHTGDKLTIDYHDGLGYIPDSLGEINQYLSDFRTGESHPIDPKLLDILHHLKKVSNSDGVFEVISGYRSPATNSKLRNKSNGVAKRSLHMQGKAIDIRLTDCDTHTLHKTCRSLAKGGVGYYRKSDFIHVDTGRVRYW
jgi:uncharacterized protein YcbK (DUF882 family)